MNNSNITLTLPAERLFARVARQTASSVADLVIGDDRHEPAGRDFSHAFELAVSEAFTNSVTHARESATPQVVKLTFFFEQRQLVVSVHDANDPFTIETPVPDIESYPENGFGLLIIRKVMDHVTYRREGNYNIISMSKTL
ncbi:MAG: ATP-binding protein [Chlorobaculum sp.]|jgi:serine/threonine-protein kinase RsbW|nr:ATP-binding protein [Chlorobaculum sp.]